MDLDEKNHGRRNTRLFLMGTFLYVAAYVYLRHLQVTGVIPELYHDAVRTGFYILLMADIFVMAWIYKDYFGRTITSEVDEIFAKKESEYDYNDKKHKYILKKKSKDTNVFENVKKEIKNDEQHVNLNGVVKNKSDKVQSDKVQPDKSDSNLPRESDVNQPVDSSSTSSKTLLYDDLVKKTQKILSAPMAVDFVQSTDNIKLENDVLKNSSSNKSSSDISDKSSSSTSKKITCSSDISKKSSSTHSKTFDNSENNV